MLNDIRFLQIQDYPNPFGYKKETLHNLKSGWKEPEWFREYPHLFQELEWFEYRTEDEMPKYLKNKLYSNIYYSVIQNFVGLHHEMVKVFDGKVNSTQRYENLEPATREEYRNSLTPTNDLSKWLKELK